MIFFSHFINLGGALYFKSLEFTLLSEQLRLPLSTILNLALFNLFIILSHKIYRNLKISIYIKSKINNFLEKFEFYNFKETNILYVLSIIAIFTKLFYYNVNIPIQSQMTIVGDPTFLQDIMYGFNSLLLLPVVIFFSDLLYDTKYFNKKNYFFIIFIIFMILYSFSINNRSSLFDSVFLSSIIIFILFLFNKIRGNKTFFLKFIFCLILVFPATNFLENLSRSYIAERTVFIERTQMENIKSFINNAFSKENLEYYDKIDSSKHNTFFSESYYNKSLYNRINFLLVHDNFNYLKKVLSQKQIEDIKKLQINKIISIVPQPVINIFTNNFNKNDYLKYSTASYIYGTYDFRHGPRNVGSALMTLYIIFDNWVYLILLFFFIPFFIIFDSFYNNKLMVFSPFILIFFYTTGSGVLNFIAATDISIWFTLAFRFIPQTLLFVLIINYFYKFFVKGNIK